MARSLTPFFPEDLVTNKVQEPTTVIAGVVYGDGVLRREGGREGGREKGREKGREGAREEGEGRDTTATHKLYQNIPAPFIDNQFSNLGTTTAIIV